MKKTQNRKRVVRLNESRLGRIIKESMKRVLKEDVVTGDIIVYIDPNSDNDYNGVDNLEDFKRAARTDDSIHLYRGLDDFIEAFNYGYISDEGYLAHPM